MTFLAHVVASIIIGTVIFPYTAGRIIRKLRNGYGDINRNFIIDPMVIRLIADAMRNQPYHRMTVEQDKEAAR